MTCYRIIVILANLLVISIYRVGRNIDNMTNTIGYEGRNGRVVIRTTVEISAILLRASSKDLTFLNTPTYTIVESSDPDFPKDSVPVLDMTMKDNMSIKIHVESDPVEIYNVIEQFDKLAASNRDEYNKMIQNNNRKIVNIYEIVPTHCIVGIKTSKLKLTPSKN